MPGRVCVGGLRWGSKAATMASTSTCRLCKGTVTHPGSLLAGSFCSFAWMRCTLRVLPTPARRDLITLTDDLHTISIQVTFMDNFILNINHSAMSQAYVRILSPNLTPWFLSIHCLVSYAVIISVHMMQNHTDRCVSSLHAAFCEPLDDSLVLRYCCISSSL